MPRAFRHTADLAAGLMQCLCQQAGPQDITTTSTWTSPGMSTPNCPPGTQQGVTHTHTVLLGCPLAVSHTKPACAPLHAQPCHSQAEMNQPQQRPGLGHTRGFKGALKADLFAKHSKTIRKEFSLSLRWNKRSFQHRQTPGLTTETQPETMPPTFQPSTFHS